MGYAMNSSALKNVMYQDLYSFTMPASEELNLGVPDISLFETHLDITKLNMSSLVLLYVGRKSSDLGADNTLKVKIDGITKMSVVFTNDSVATGLVAYGLSSHSGKIKIEVYMDSGGDDGQRFQMLKLYCNRSS